MLKRKIDPEGYVNFWGPFLAALVVFLVILYFFATDATNQIEKNIQENVDKKFDQKQLPPVYVPKLDPVSQAKIDTIEARREISHLHVDNMYNGEIQNVLDTLFNNR